MNKNLNDLMALINNKESALINDNNQIKEAENKNTKSENTVNKDSILNGYNVETLANLLALTIEEIEYIRLSIDGK